MDITLIYQKERQDFGRPVNHFAPSAVEVLDEFLPIKEDYAHIEINPQHLDIQASAMMSESMVRCADGRTVQHSETASRIGNLAHRTVD